MVAAIGIDLLTISHLDDDLHVVDATATDEHTVRRGGERRLVTSPRPGMFMLNSLHLC